MMESITCCCVRGDAIALMLSRSGGGDDHDDDEEKEVQEGDEDKDESGSNHSNMFGHDETITTETLVAATRTMIER